MGFKSKDYRGFSRRTREPRDREIRSQEIYKFGAVVNSISSIRLEFRTNSVLCGGGICKK